MKAGDRIKVDVGTWCPEWQEFTVEEFRYCLGIFGSEEHREAGQFTPLCNLYCAGPESEKKYISNFGEYITNMVPAWSDIP